MHAIDQEEQSPFIGRRIELARLDASLARAISGRPELVLVAGDAGVGKTRLTEELRYRVESAGPRRWWADVSTWRMDDFRWSRLSRHCDQV